jgi:hypothetical protein
MASDDLDTVQVAVVAQAVPDTKSHSTTGHTRLSRSPDAPRLPSPESSYSSTSSIIAEDGVPDKKRLTPTPPSSPDASRLPSTPSRHNTSRTADVDGVSDFKKYSSPPYTPSSATRDASHLRKHARNSVDDFPISPISDWSSSQPPSPLTPSARHSNARVPDRKRRRRESIVETVAIVGSSQQLPSPPPSVRRSSKLRVSFWKNRHLQIKGPVGTVATVGSGRLPSSPTPSARSSDIRVRRHKKVPVESVATVGNHSTEREAEDSSRLSPVGLAQSNAHTLLSHTQMDATGSDGPARLSSPASALTQPLHPSSSPSGENTGSDAVRSGKRKRDNTDVGHKPKEARPSVRNFLHRSLGL